MKYITIMSFFLFVNISASNYFYTLDNKNAGIVVSDFVQEDKDVKKEIRTVSDLLSQGNISCSSERVGSECFKMFDNNNNSNWYSALGVSNGVNMYFDFNKKITITSTDYIGMQGSPIENTAIQRFELYYSNNNTDWTMYNGTHSFSKSQGNLVTRIITTEENAELLPYAQYWRIYITRNHGHSNGVVGYEMNFYGYEE